MRRNNNQSPAQPKKKKPEMWLLDLAKSNIMMAFSKTCELVLFFGCLWITLTMTYPEAKTWLSGGVNIFFLTCMGFAIDAAFPESWVHVVRQHLEKKTGQFKWSRAIAIMMTALVAGNIIYAMFTGGAQQSAASGMPTDVQGWAVDILIIVRLLLGISYVAIRECQSFLDRAAQNDQPATVPAVDVQAMITEAITALSEKMEQRLEQLWNAFQTFQTVPPIVPVVDNQAIIAGVVGQFETRFTGIMERLEVEVKRSVLIAQVESGTQEPQVDRKNGTQVSGPRLVSLPQRTTPVRPVERKVEPATGPQEAVENPNNKATIYALLDQDNTVLVPDLVRMTGIAKTTVWRYWDRYHKEHGTRGMARIVSGETDQDQEVVNG